MTGRASVPSIFVCGLPVGGLNSDDGKDSHLDAGLRHLLESGSIAKELGSWDVDGGWPAKRWSSGERMLVEGG